MLIWFILTYFSGGSKLKKGHFESNQKEENNEFQHNGINKIPMGDLPFKVIFAGQIGGFSLEKPNFMNSFFFQTNRNFFKLGMKNYSIIKIGLILVYKNQFGYVLCTESRAKFQV